MTSPRDDDALSWEGDDDPTLATAAAPAATRAPVLPEGFRAVGRGSTSAAEPPAGSDVTDALATDSDSAADAGSDTGTGNVALVSLGVLAGMYLLGTLGWLVGGLRLHDTALFLVSSAIYVPALVLAVLAPPLWFGAALVLTRRSATWVRFAWLAAGLVLLVPWPFVMVGAVGQ